MSNYNICDRVGCMNIVGAQHNLCAKHRRGSSRGRGSSKSQNARENKPVKLNNLTMGDLESLIKDILSEKGYD